MSLVVEPAPVRKPRRGPDPAPFVLVAIVAFVALAIAKPWQPAPRPAPSEAPQPAPSQPDTAAGSPPPSTPAANASPGQNDTGGPATSGPLRWSDLLDALTPQASYGLRIVTRANATPPATLPAGALASEPNVTASIDGAYHVTWLPSHGVDYPVMVVDPDPGSPILAVGVTARAGLAPLDVRFWRLVRGRPPERLSPPAVSGDPVLGDRLFLPPAEDGAVAGWLPGSYYVDLLEGGSVARFEFELWTGDPARDPPRRFNPPPPLDEVVRLDALGIAAGAAGLPRAPFTVDTAGHGHGWVADPGPPLDDAAAWLAEASIPVAPAVVGQVVANGQVARAYGPEPAAIGVILPRGAIVVSAHLVSLAPEAGVVSDAPLVGPVGPVTTTTEQGAPRREANFSQRAFVAFVPTETDTWPAGVYRVDVDYIGAAGLDTQTSWHIDVAATGAVQASAAVPALLDAAEHWAGVPSGWAIVTGGTTPSGGTIPPAPGPIVVWPDPPRLPDVSVPPRADTAPVCDDAAVLDSSRTVIGLRVPDAARDVRLKVVRVFPGIGGVLVPAVVASGVQPGMWLLAPPASSGRAWASGLYHIEVAGGSSTPAFFEGVYRLCFGSFASVNPTFSLAAGSLGMSVYRAARLDPGAEDYRVLQPGSDPVMLDQ